MSKKIKIKKLSCRPLEENQKIFVGKKIVGYSQTGGGISPSYINCPNEVERHYTFVDEIFLILQDDEGNRTAVKIHSLSFSYENEELFESKHRGKKLTSNQKKYLSDSLKYINSYIPRNAAKEEHFPDPFLAMKSTSFNGNVENPELAFGYIDGIEYKSFDEIIDDDFIKQKKTAPTV